MRRAVEIGENEFVSFCFNGTDSELAIEKAKCCAAVIQTAGGSAKKRIVGKDHWGEAVGEEMDNKFFWSVRQDGVYVFMQL